MTLKDFMIVEGNRFLNWTWVTVMFKGKEISIGKDYIAGASEDWVINTLYPREIQSISLKDFEKVDHHIYFEYEIYLF